MSEPLIEGIAVVGLACRFPGAENPAAFWRNLRQGVESVRFFSPEELEAAGVDPALLRHPDYVRARAVLDQIDLFDAHFFGLNPRVAEVTDPQQRLFLECAWEGLEDAGYDSATGGSAIGVYAGVGLGSYLLENYATRRDALGEVGVLQALISNRTDHLTTSVAYRLNLKGPAVTVQTTCSTSLVAVHLACQSLLSYQCDMALAGGVAIEIPQNEGYLYAEGGIASPDGHCRPFDARAQGIVSGSGAGIVVLKRLSEALEDGDSIRAVIRGTAINNDGSDKVGYTAPAVDGQAQVIAMAQAVAGVEPREVSYVEAHGTATPMGDPIEIAALKKVFGDRASAGPTCGLGSVKSNFGHLDTAAGIAGLIKTVLALEHGELPPSLGFERPNPALELDGSPFYVNAELRDWPVGDEPRRAGVSSFGIGGTNAHAVLEEAPATEPSGPSRPWQLLLLSARSSPALEAASERLRHHLEEHPEESIGDVAFTLQSGRRAFEYRRAVICRDGAGAAKLLASLDPTRVYTSLREPRRLSPLFLFPGQGSQHVGMGRQLYESETVFRQEVDRCCDLLTPLLELDLRTVLYPPAEQQEEATEQLRQTALAQPAIFVVEVALARLWMSWGLSPAAMIGHSIGEYVAAYLAEVMTLEEALALVADRGRLIQDLPGGAMLALPLGEAEARELLGDELSLAAVNRPSMCVVSGPRAAVEALQAELTAKGVVCRPLHTSHAFHSRMMEPAVQPFIERLGKVRLRPPKIPYISNLTGTWIKDDEATDPRYWAEHLRRTVRFSDGVETLLGEVEGISLEVGPGTTLRTLLRQHPARPAGHQVFSSFAHPREQEPEMAAILTTLGRLWLAGTAVDWQGFHGAERRRRLPLPTYPFERRRYWLEPGKAGALAPTTLGRKSDPADWFYAPSWQRAPAPLVAGGSNLAGQVWLLFADPSSLYDGLIKKLRELGAEVVSVSAGERFSVGGEGGADFTLAPERPEDYGELLAELSRQGRKPARIVHLLSASPESAETITPAEAITSAETLTSAEAGDPTFFERQLERGYYSLIYLAQALGRETLDEPPRLDVVSSNMQEVTGGELLWPEKAALLGPCRVIPKEYAGLICRSIDLDTRPESSSRLDPVEQLTGELLAAAAPQIVALRGGYRWTPGFDALRLEALASDPKPEAVGLRPGGCYLITGGLGGMGLTLAEHLAREVSAKLVLTGRSALPPRSSWDDWLAQHGESEGEDAQVAAKIHRVQQLEELGAEVLLLQADVADSDEMARAVEQALERFGEIHGVIHAAGVSPGGIIQLQSPEQAAEPLLPKVRGTRLLASLLASQRLDFFILCSSRGAFLAPPGSVSYAAANAFLDAFAASLKLTGHGLMTSIDWCAWKDVGMLVDAATAGRAAPAPEPAPEDASEDQGEAIDYPLFDRRLERPGGEQVLSGLFSVRKRWVLDEHRIAGVPVVPGTTYLEMARAALEMGGNKGPLEMFDVYFLAPVGVREDEEREIRLEVEPVGDAFDFRVSSRARNGAEGAWQQNVLGKMRPIAPPPSRQHDLAEITARCRRGELIAALEDEQREDLGPRWHAVQQVHIGDGEVLASLELAEEFANDLETLSLHPALLDRSASLGEQFLVEERGAYLPMSYHRLEIAAPLPRKIYSWARLRDEPNVKSGARRETFSFDVELMDEDGVVLVGIENFSKKLIHDPSAQLKQPGVTGGAPATSPATAAPDEGEADDAYDVAFSRGVSPPEGVEAWRRILAHRASPQVVVSPSDLGAVIHEAESVDPFAIDEDETPAGPSVFHERPDLDVAYRPPADEREERLAELWQEMFGIGQVGADDNFFELGGDSVLGIQIVAKARKAGLEITPNQLFEHQTIAELARVVGFEGGIEAPTVAVMPPLSDDQLTRLRQLAAAADSGDIEARDAEAHHADGDEHAPEAPIEDAYRLSPVQQGMLFHSLYAPHSGDYVLQLYWAVHGDFDAEAFEHAWQRALERHPILRTAFFWNGLEEPLQAVRPTVELRIERLDWRHVPAGEHEERLATFLEADRRRGFDLSDAPLMRLTRMDLADGSCQVVWSHHHLLLDGWSIPLVLQDVSALYAAHREGAEAELEESPSYRDYIAWLESLDRSRDEPFWRRALESFETPTSFVSGRAQEAANVSDEGTEEVYRGLLHHLSPALSEHLQELTRRHKLTMNTLVQGAWGLLLGAYSGEEDVVFGGAVSGRPPALEGVERIVGPFINTLPVRVRATRNAELVPWLRELQAAQLEARGFEHVSLLDIQGWSEVPQGQPLFDCLLIFENLPQGEELSFEESAFEIRALRRSEGRTGYPLALAVFPGDELALYLTAHADAFKDSALRRLAAQLETLLWAFTEHSDQRLEALPWLNTTERHQVLVEWNESPPPPTLAGETLPELFAAQAVRCPDAVALTLGGRSLSYGELARRSSQLAAALRDRGVGPEERAGIYLERSPEMVIALLAVLEAGGAYVPLDLRAPRERLARLLDGLVPRVVLTQRRLLPSLPPELESVLAIEDICPTDGGLGEANEELRPSAVGPLADNLAYLLYTSGSTGAPKGVCCSHRGVVRYLADFIARWRLDQADAALQVTSLPFDPSVRDLFAPLAVGGRVVLLHEDSARDPAALLATLLEQRVTCMLSSVPSLLNEIVRTAASREAQGFCLRLAMANGEVLPAALAGQAREAFGSRLRLVNQYGPTECTMTTACHEVATAPTVARGAAPLGRPISTDRIFLLDRRLAAVPAGVGGELHIASDRLARGYHGRPALTAESFVPNPYAEHPGERLYRTGDRVTRLAGGELLFLGRVDHQVKLRGFRVEPGEIEAALEEHEAVTRAVALPRQDLPGGAGIAAYLVRENAVTGQSSEDPTDEALRSFLETRLPAYMVPASFQFLDALPQTPAGKIDRGALSRETLPAAATERERAALSTATEHRLAEIFSELLGTQNVGALDHFFALGGHSLLAMRLVARLREQLGVEIPLRQVFESPTLRGLATVVDATHHRGQEQEGPQLERVDRGGDLPLSFTQERLWFLEQLHPGSVYVIPAAVRARGELDLGALEASLRGVVARHEILRTTFPAQGGQPVQRIADTVDVAVPLIDLEALPAAALERQSEALTSESSTAPFDLADGPLLRLRVVRESATDHLLLLNMHHVVADGWSVAQLIHELAEHYAAASERRPARLEPLALQYADFAHWQRRWLNDEALTTQRAYWRERLAGEVPVLELPTDRPRPKVQTFRGGESELRLPDALSADLRQLSQDTGATLFMTLLAAFKVLLHRLASQDDVLVGIPVAGRDRPQTEALIGPFINTLVLWTELDGRPSFTEVLEQVRESALGAFAHQDVPFERVLQDLGVERDPSRTPLFQILFNMLNFPEEGVEVADLRLEYQRTPDVGAKFDITLYAAERGDSVVFKLVYNADLFDRERIDELLHQYEGLLVQIVAAPERSIDRLSLVTPAAHEWLPDPSVPIEETLFESVAATFRRRAAETPSAPALRFAEGSLSYEELEAQALAVAARLRRRGVDEGTVVAVWGPRSPQLVSAVLGVFLGGGVLLLLDRKLPRQRLRTMLGRAKARHLLYVGERRLADRWLTRDEDLEVLRLGGAEPAELELPEPRPEAPAYIFFTSGTTGTPKGILGQQKSLSHFLAWQRQRFDIGSGDRVAFLTGLSFDVVLRDLLLPLTSGATLCLPPAEELGTEETLAWLAADEITVLHTVPSLASTWLHRPPAASRLPALRRVFFAGEPLYDSLVGRWRRAFSASAEVVNLYGPTETTLAKCFYPVPEPPPPGRQAVGTAMPQAQALVLTTGGRLCGVGERGEITIRTPMRSLGYLGGSDRDEARFKLNPFRDDPDDLIFATGDLGRYRPDGQLEILGRLDDQVKVRGMRVEPGEVQSTILRRPEIAHCEVLALPGPADDRRLIAFVVPQAKGGGPEPGNLDHEELRRQLAQTLPEYMLPSAILALESLPLTANGKVDRRALAQMSWREPAPAETLDTGFETPTEELLAGIFRELLDVDRVGRSSGFFDLGGHSLLAMRMLSRVREVLGVELGLRTVFDSPTVADLAAAAENLRRRGTPGAPPLRPLTRDERTVRGLPPSTWPLSFAQQRLWFLDQLTPQSAAYNIPAAVRLPGPLSPAALSAALGEIVRRHEILRTLFIELDGEPAQQVQPASAVTFALPMVDLQGLSEVSREAEVRRLAHREAETPFDLGTGPLLRCTFLKTAEEEQVILLTLHHIVSDDWSMGLLVEELGILYDAYALGRPSPLPELEIQYADFAAWQRRSRSQEALDAELSFWRQQLADPPPPLLELPFDRPRPAVQTFAGGRCLFTLEPALAGAIEATSQGLGATLHMTLLAAFQVLLGRISGQRDITVGIPIAGRNHLLTERLIGFFVNTLVIRTDLSSGADFATLVESVRETTLAAYAHQELPFERLVAELDLKRDLSTTLLFQVLFEVRNRPVEQADAAGAFSSTRLPVERGTAKFDLSVLLVGGGEGLEGRIELNRDLFDLTTIERLSRHFVTLLGQMAANPGRPLQELSLLGPSERQQLLREWNPCRPTTAGEAALHHAFEKRAEEAPEAVALSFGDATWSYGELDRQANRLAHALRERGVGPEAHVALFGGRSLQMVVGMLATLKAGGAYLGIDPAYPPTRTAAILRATDPTCVLTQERWRPSLPSLENLEIIGLDHGRATWITQPSTAPPASAAGDHLAYVVHTSGSTGEPKGICGTHRGAAGYLADSVARWRLGPDDTALQLAALTVDASLRDLLGPLSAGARVAMVDDEVARDPLAILTTLREQRVSCLPSLVPTLLGELFAASTEPVPALRLILASGEVLPEGSQQRARRLWGSGVRLVNQYGPSEGTLTSTAYPLGDDGGRVAIGRPIDTVSLYVLDRRLELVPSGVRGEGDLSGPGLVRGYLDRPAWTAEAFLPDPFAGRPGARMYRTGDRLRLRANGIAEFHGRLDQQIKLRGRRLELGEVEAALRRLEPITAAAVVASKESRADREGGAQRLLAFYVTAQEGPLEGRELRRRLGRELPDFMIPHAFLPLEALPRTASGKIDRKALHALAAERPQEPPKPRHETPRTDAERLLADIWSEVLQVEQVGRDDNFFDLGGDSLSSIRVLVKARRRGLDFSVRQIFEHQRLVDLAAVAKLSNATEPTETVASGALTGSDEATPLTPIQQGFFERPFANPHHWNMTRLYEIHGEVDKALLESALERLATEHGALQLRFFEDAGDWRQKRAGAAGNVRLSTIDLGAVPAARRRLVLEQASAAAQGSLHLSSGPILRLVFFTLGAGEVDRLLFIGHHLVLDDVSMQILTDDLQAAYLQLARRRQATLQVPSTTPFEIWAERLADFARSPEIEEEKRYWLELPWSRIGRLPADFAAGENTSESIRRVKWRVDARDSELILSELPRRLGCRVDEILLAAVIRALVDWTGHSEQLIVMARHGREPIFEGIDVARTVGWFVVNHPVLLTLNGAGDEVGALRSISSQLRRVPRGGIGYGVLRYMSQDPEIRERMQTLPPAEIGFNYHGHRRTVEGERQALLRVARENPGPFSHGSHTRPSLLNISSRAVDGVLELDWLYSRNRHRESTIESLASRCAETLLSMISPFRGHEEG